MYITVVEATLFNIVSNADVTAVAPEEGRLSTVTRRFQRPHRSELKPPRC